MKYRPRFFRALALTALLIPACGTATPEPEPVKPDPTPPPKRIKKMIKRGKPRPNTPLNLTGPLPFDDEIETMVDSAVSMLLEQQQANGSWDMLVVKGGGLAAEADRALDAVLMTSLCGIALRAHEGSNPGAVDPALDKAVDFVMDRVQRGKLSTMIRYACWRYVFSLQFLISESQATKDPVRMEKLRLISQEIIGKLRDMQMISRGREAASKPQFVFRKPAPLGLTVKTRTDAQGAVVGEVATDGAADQAGLKKDDVLVTVNGRHLINRYGYYARELSWVDGETVQFQILRDRKMHTIDVTVPTRYPGELGVRWGQDENDRYVIYTFAELSHADDVGLQVGDVVLQVGDQKIQTEKDLEALDGVLFSGHEIVVKVERDKVPLEFKVPLVPVPQANFRIRLEEEDKGDDDGVVINGFIRNSCSKAAGLKEGDRIVEIDGRPVMGMDHFFELEASLWEGQKVKVKALDGWGGDKTVTVTLDSKTAIDKSIIRGYHGIKEKRGKKLPATIGDIDSDSPAERSGLKKGDLVKSVNGNEVESGVQLANALFRNFVGDKITLVVERTSDDNTTKITNTYSFTMERAPSAWSVAKKDYAGGWNYYSFVGGSNTFVSGSVIRTLLDARDKLGCDVPEEVFRNAIGVLNYTRMKDSRAPIESYTYDTRRNDRDLRGHLGRLPGAELASFLASREGFTEGKNLRTVAHLEQALSTWLDRRYELDRVRHFKGTHNRQLYLNAAYYWLFGHRSASIASNYVQDAKLKQRLQETLLRAYAVTYLPKTRGWIGHSAFGSLTGTSQALIALGQLRGSVWERGKSRANQFGPRREAITLLRRTNPVLAIDHGWRLLLSFKDHPEAKAWENTLWSWQDDGRVDLFEKDSASLTKLMNDAIFKDFLATRAKLMPTLDKIRAIATAHKGTVLGDKALAYVKKVETSFEGRGYVGFNADPKYKGKGVKIGQVTPKTPAAYSGLKPGDLITSMEGKPVKNFDELLKQLKPRKPMETITFEVTRKGKSRKVMVILARRL